MADSSARPTLEDGVDNALGLLKCDGSHEMTVDAVTPAMRRSASRFAIFLAVIP